MPSFWWKYTYWYLTSLVLRQNERHFTADDTSDCIFFHEHLNIWSLFPGIQLTMSQHGTMFWLGAVQGTSIVWINDDLVERRIYASVGMTELSTMLLYDRTRTETEMSSGLLRPGSHWGRWSLPSTPPVITRKSSWRPIRLCDYFAVCLYTVF